jgi:hypothetical protein
MSLAVAAETPGLWDVGDAEASASRLAGLSTGVDALVSVRVDELSDGEVEAELGVVEVARRRLEVRANRLAAALTSRRARRAREADPGDGRAGERAAREARRELADMLNWTPQQAKGATDAGRVMLWHPGAAAAADRGELSARHLTVLSEVLDHLCAGVRDDLEAELVEAGKGMDAREFGRLCRRRLAEVDHDAAMRDLDAKHARRRAALFTDDDGMTVLHGRWVGLDAETVATSVHAFRRPDRPGEHRTPEQRTADAVLDALGAALRAAQAPSEHGVRPHVTLTASITDLVDQQGAGEGRWTGPIPYGELRRLLDDAGLGWVVRDEGGLPMEAGPEVRTVPAGLWRALEDRDGGCIRDGCDTPASWCDVMHLGRRYADGGRLTLATAGLGCRHHHRAYDRGGLTLHWNDGRPTLRRPHRTTDPPEGGGTPDGPDP